MPPPLSQGPLLKASIMFVVSHVSVIDDNERGVVTPPQAVVASICGGRSSKKTFFICELSTSLLAVRVYRVQSQSFS